MSAGVLDALEDDENGKEDGAACELNLVEEREIKQTAEQLANQERIKKEIKWFFLESLGGVPENYYKTEVRKLWGSRYRVNLTTKTSSGNIKYPFSCWVHYQRGAISFDTKTPVTKQYNNFETLFNKETENAPR